MTRTETINYIIQKKGFKSYLEIGTQYGWNYDLINIELKECCDVDDTYHEMTYVMSSDEMFAKMPLDKKYDIIFIDGLHNELYVHRDIINSLKHLNPGGIICVHDVLPQKFYTSTEKIIPEIDGTWNGDVWKAIVNLQNLNIEYYTIHNNDSGLTIIKYLDNPFKFNISNIKNDYSYNYIFDDNYPASDINHFTTQGKFAMHVITEDQLNYIL